MTTTPTKSKGKIENLPSLDLDFDINDCISPPHSIKSPSSQASSSYINSSTSQIDIPFPDMPNYDDDDEVPHDIYSPQTPTSPYGINQVSSWASASSFDGEIEKFFTDMAKESTDNPEISLLILNTWNELSKSDPGHPGELLAEKMNSIPEESLSPTLLKQIFSQLDDIRTTISSPITSCLFYQSCLTLYQNLPKNTILGDYSLDLFRESIITACTIIGNEIVDLYVKAIQFPVESEKFSNLENKLIEIRKRFKTPSEEKLFTCVIEYVDCHLSNTVIINHLCENLFSASRMNTNISEIEAHTNIKLVKFQELILLVLANNAILSDPKIYRDFAPHIEPNLAYLVLCNIHPDDLQPEKIDYKLIEKFMDTFKISLNVKHEDILLKIENIEINEWDSIQI